MFIYSKYKFSKTPFKLEKSTEKHSRKYYLSVAIVSFIILESFAIEILSLPFNLQEINLLSFNGFWEALGHYGSGLLFLIGGCYLSLLYLLAFFQIDTKWNQDITGTAFIIDLDGFHIKSPFTDQITKSFLWSSNYVLKTKFSDVSNFFLLKVVSGENTDKAIYEEKFSLNSLKRSDIDHFLFLDSLKDQNFVQLQR